MSVPEVRALLVHLLDKRHWNEDEILEWSRWRQERNRIAKECHRKRRQDAVNADDLAKRNRSTKEAL
jgi:hypothetical protein